MKTLKENRRRDLEAATAKSQSDYCDASKECHRDGAGQAD